MVQKLISTRELPGELLVQGERVPVRLLFALYFVAREGEPDTQREAYLDMRLSLPDGSLLHVGDFFTKRTLTAAAAMLEEVASGVRSAGVMYGIDYFFDLTLRSVAGSPSQVSASGDYVGTQADTHIGPQWRGLITLHPGRGYTGATLHGLTLTRADIQTLSDVLRQCLHEIGDKLPEPSAYDD